MVEAVGGLVAAQPAQQARQLALEAAQGAAAIAAQPARLVDAKERAASPAAHGGGADTLCMYWRWVKMSYCSR